MKKLVAFCLILAIVIVCSACTPNSNDDLISTGSKATLVTDVTSTDTTSPEDLDENVSSINDTSSVNDNTSSIRNTSSIVNTESNPTEYNPTECSHSYTDATCTTPKKCLNCGVTEGEARGHNFKNATCTTPKTCLSCGVTEGVAQAHKYAKATCTSPKTCTQCGKASGSALGHKYVSDKCVRINNGRKCNVTYDPSYCPKLYFTGDMSSMNSKSDVRNIEFEYKSKEQNISGAAKIKVQGSSSLAYDKKNFTINFYNNSDYSDKLGINVGWGKQSEYCLKANWIDKTHSRNVVTAKLVGEIQAKYGLFEETPNGGAIDGFPVEIYINDEFHGLYTMNVPKDEWMFGMNGSNPDHIVICGEGWLDANLFKADPDFSTWSVEVGPENEETLNKMKRLFSFIRNSSDAEFVKNFNQYLDLDATLNYYIMMDFGYMPDNLGKNMLLATYDGKVWYPSLYDLDTTWGASWTGNELYDYKNNLVDMSSSLLWTRVEKLFSKQLAERYFELRKDILDVNYVMETFNDFHNSIPTEVLEREVAKWGKNIPGYNLEQIQEYLDCAVPMLDSKYNNFK